MRKPYRWLLAGLLIWMILDGLQAYFTELDPDEAYYWMYAQKLDWGYFDHPPMVALMIRLGYELVANELGVRLLTILMHAGTLYLLWLLAGRPSEKKELWILLLLVGAMPMFQLYGFITTPDPPLIFFTALFFWRYQKFLSSESWGNVFLLGLTMALMLYSKYHGILVIFFTLASNWRLMLRPRFYIASIFGAFLFLPHLWWQLANEFPSLKYHLIGRNDPYALKHTINYLINQVVNFSPFLFPLWILVLKKWRIKDPILRAYYYTVIGFWGFFLIATIKGHAEPQWTVVLIIPLTLLGIHYLRDHPYRRRLFRQLSIASMVLVFALRIILITPLGARLMPAFHKKGWIMALKEKAGEQPVLFLDNYRDPSSYSFYTSDFSVALNDPVSYRRNQFDIWSYEEQYHDKDVLLFGLPRWIYCRDGELFSHFGKNRKTCSANGLQIVQKVEVSVRKEKTLTAMSGQAWKLPVNMHNPYDHDIDLEDASWPVRSILYIAGPERSWEANASMNIKTLPANSNITATWESTLPQLKAGAYQLFFMLEGNGMVYSINSEGYTIQVK